MEILYRLRGIKIASRLVLQTLLMAFMCSGLALFAQSAKTTIPVKNLRGLSSASGSVVAVTPAGQVVVARLGEGIVLDTSGTVPVLRVVAPATPQIVFVDGERPVPGGEGNRIFSLASAPNPVSSLMVYLNGILLTAGVDYTVSGSTVTLVEHYAGINTSNSVPEGERDVLTVSYRRVIP